ncbi:MAG: ATP-binding protein [Stomatobaculum sp.]|nr:ATP-binding protein [Stomatobaculum sp.]
MPHHLKPHFSHPPLPFRLTLIVLFLLFGCIPFFFKGTVLTKTFSQATLENRQNEIQNRSRILSTKLTRSGYLKNTAEQDTALNTEMDTVASVYDGRIVLIDNNYRVIRDTFHLAEGRYHVAPEVIRCFRGENLSGYNGELQYLLQTTPVYELSAEGDDRTVEGVILFIASTEKLRQSLSDTGNTHVMFDLITVLLLIPLALIVSMMVSGPFRALRHDLSVVANGDLNHQVEQNAFVVTKQISEDISTTIRKLKDAAQSRDEFVSNVSHELKTPITSIRVLADSLMSMEDAPVELYKDFMNDISGEIDREAKIIDDLLSLVRMDRSGVALERKSTDMHAMLEQILKRLRPIARLSNVDLTLETVREVKADVDEVKFSLAITNLVENAIKYNVKDGWVHVTLDADHQYCYIKVEDSGIGIPQDQIDSVFERFYRVDKARSRETGGTGLGLAITKEIVLMHQGNIRLTSTEGEGACFQVRIPLLHNENAAKPAAGKEQAE